MNSQTMKERVTFGLGVLMGAVLFACGPSIADAISSAADIMFDNDGTSLSASNVQEALKELDSNVQATSSSLGSLGGSSVEVDLSTTSLTSVNVEDAIKEVDNNVVNVTTAVNAIVIQPTVLDGGNNSLGLLMARGDNNLSVYVPSLKVILPVQEDGAVQGDSLYYESNDCSGQAYVSKSLEIVENGGSLYKGDIDTYTTITRNSFLNTIGTCFASSSSFTGFIALDVSSSFSLPIQAPLKVSN